tara:strand:+ start:21 stop:248 length:228 start_codon:yes stop_codon:yes gene_type:complete
LSLNQSFKFQGRGIDIVFKGIGSGRTTKKNLLNFLKNIKNGIYKSPNFYDAKKIHFIINKMMLSSQKNKNILINY